MKAALRFLAGLYALLAFCPTVSGTDRLKVHARINDKDGVFAMDTGMPVSLVLFEPRARHYGLEITEKNGSQTARFTLHIGEHTHTVEAGVIDSPPPDIDGLIGWPALQNNIWFIRWENESLEAVPSIPEDVSRWMHFDLARNLPVCGFRPGARDMGYVYVDTGSPGCVDVSTARWNAWRAKNPAAPTTVSAKWSPASGGMSIVERSWVDAYTLGELVIPRTMIEPSEFKWPSLEAVLGLSALSRFDVVLDLKGGRIYLNSRTEDDHVPTYNRLGVTFCPESMDAKDLIGFVLPDSPGYRQGIRTGDVLLKIDDTDMTQWKTDPEIWKKKFWSAEAGTTYDVQVQRNGQVLDLQVTLQEILPVHGRNESNRDMNHDEHEPAGKAPAKG